MLDQFLEVLGKPFVVPAAILIIGTSIIKALSGLHDSRRQHRREFLDLWRGAEGMDDMSLEVTIRHLIGTYLPANTIRAVNTLSFPTQTLFDLAEIWPLAELDHETGKVKWKKPTYAEPKSRNWLRFFLTLGYFIFACISVLFLYLAVGSDPLRPTAWISAANTLMFGIIAWGCLARSDTVGAVGKHGVGLMARINAAIPTRSSVPAENPPESL